MAPRFSAAISLVFALALSACGDDGVDRAGGETPEVELLEPGDQPRRALNFSPAAGASSVTTMEMTAQSGGEVDGTEIPEQPEVTITFELNTKIDSVEADQIDATVEYGDTSVEAIPSLKQQTEAAVEPLEGLSGKVVLAPNGAVVDATYDSLDSGNPILDSLTSQINEQTRSLSTPFPSEPVGVGARWRIENSLEVLGVNSNSVTTYELTKRVGDIYALHVQTTQTIEPGEVAGGVNIIGGSSEVDGTLEGDLGTFLPIESNSESRGTVSSEVPGPDGELRHLDQQIDFDIHLETER